jgi:hypothetical protein
MKIIIFHAKNTVQGHWWIYPLNPRTLYTSMYIFYIHRASPPMFSMWPWESLDEVAESNPVNALERLLGPWNRYAKLSERWNNSQINTVKSSLLIAPCFFDWWDSLIAPSGLLLLVSHLLADPVSILWVELEKS